MSHGLLLWLENIDRRRNEIVPIDPTKDSDVLQEHHKTLTVHNGYEFIINMVHQAQMNIFKGKARNAYRRQKQYS